jgi:beta-galactosidase
MLLVDTAKAVADYDHPFFSKYPAITENHFGKGMVTYEGTVLSAELQQKLLERVLAQAHIAGPDQKLPAAVRVKHGVNRAGKAIHYYFNFSPAAQRLVYSYARGTELLSQRSVEPASVLALEPWGVAIVEEANVAGGRE